MIGFLRVAAAAIVLAVIGTSLHDVSQAWDVWYYHLPFAGRLAGILDPHSYAFSAENQERYDRETEEHMQASIGAIYRQYNAVGSRWFNWAQRPAHA